MINTKSSTGAPNFEKPKKTRRHFCETVDVSSYDSKIPSRVKRMLKKMKQQQQVAE